MRHPTRITAAALLIMTATTTLSARADDGIYFALGLNAVSVDDERIDDSDTKLGFRLGYMFNSWIGLEGGLQRLGDFRQRDTELEVDALTGALVVNVPIALIDIYARLGIANVDSDLTVGPVSGLYSDRGVGHLVRFCFGKRDEVLQGAVARLEAHFTSS